MQIERLNSYHFPTAKPVIYLVNMKKKSFLKKGGKAYVCAAACLDLSQLTCAQLANQPRRHRGVGEGSLG